MCFHSFASQHPKQDHSATQQESQTPNLTFQSFTNTIKKPNISIPLHPFLISSPERITMHRRIRRAYTTLVEQGHTKLATISCHSQLDLIIAKATSPNDLPLPEHCVWELAIIFSSSPSLSRSFALSFTRRFGQTKCWRVALKCLLLLHLLLRTLPSNHPFRADIISARANALISFNPCLFRDASSSYSGEYSVFIQSYAHLIDEVLNCYDSIAKEDYSIASEDHTPPPLSPPSPPGSTCEERLSEAGQALELVQQLQGLMDQAMECVPVGPAARSFIIRSAMKQVARESFMSYLAARQGLAVVLDSILQMPYRSCIEGLGLYKRAAEQAIRLGEFYQWCKGMGFCAQYEYPLVEKIPKIQVVMLETFVEQVWQLTESSSASSPANSPSPASEEEQGSGTLGTGMEIVISEEWVKFEEECEEGEEEKQLIKFQDDETSWEVLLDASLKCPWNDQNIHEPWKSWSREDEARSGREKDEKSLQLFNPHFFNPFFWS